MVFLELQYSKRRSGFAALSPNDSMVAKLRTVYRYQHSFYPKFCNDL